MRPTLPSIPLTNPRPPDLRVHLQHDQLTSNPRHPSPLQPLPPLRPRSKPQIQHRRNPHPRQLPSHCRNLRLTPTHPFQRPGKIILLRTIHPIQPTHPVINRKPHPAHPLRNLPRSRSLPSPRRPRHQRPRRILISIHGASLQESSKLRSGPARNQLALRSTP